MPAAAVIPAPIAYIKVAAVKKLVVGSRVGGGGSRRSLPYRSSRSRLRGYCSASPTSRFPYLLVVLSKVRRGGRNVARLVPLTGCLTGSARLP